MSRSRQEPILLSDVRSALLGIAIAALGGAAVGVQRQRAYRENEPGAIRGLRTFAILGTVAGTCGFLVTMCLVPAFDGAFLSTAWKEALWGKFYTVAPPRQRRSIERYNIVKRA